MEALFWMVIIIIWVLSFLAKAKKSLPKQGLPQQAPPSQEPTEMERKILQALGFPFPAEGDEEPKPKMKPRPISVAEKKKFKQPPVSSVSVQAEAEKPKREPPLAFSVDKLQEGVILAVILGPPKVYQYLGLGIGRRAFV